MSKIIIENLSKVEDADVIKYVEAVIRMGRISVHSDGREQYCFLTKFSPDIVVSVSLNKISDKFTIWNDK